MTLTVSSGQKTGDSSRDCGKVRSPAGDYDYDVVIVIGFWTFDQSALEVDPSRSAYQACDQVTSFNGRGCCYEEERNRSYYKVVPS